MEKDIGKAAHFLWSKHYIQEEHSAEVVVEKALEWAFSIASKYAHPLLLKEAINSRINNAQSSTI